MKKLLSICVLTLLTTLLTAQVTKTINVEIAGTLSSLLTDVEKATITDFTVSGNIDAQDIFFMRDEIKYMKTLDISKVNIEENSGYSANELPQMAFYNCAELTSIILPDSITSTGQQSFLSCKNLKVVEIPNKVTKISSYSFGYCTSLDSFSVPENITTIEAGAFTSCTNLTSITIPKNLTSLDERAFADCSKLTTIIIDENNPIYSSFDGVIYDKYKTKLIFCTPAKSGDYIVDFKYTLKTIGDFAFCWCKNLTSIVLPNSVDTIGNYAFYYGCPNLSSVNIPSNLKYIGDYAFAGCNLSGAINIPSSVNFIGDFAFNCLNLLSISVHSDNLNYSSDDGILYDKEKTKLIFCPRGKNGNIIMPESVTDIYKNAFNYCQYVTSITLSSNLKNIGDWAFSYTPITSITIPDGTTSIGTSAFGGCKNMVSVTLPKSISTIGDLAFQACPNLTSITIPDGVKTIGQNAFSNCTGLTTVNLPNSVDVIGAWAFANCSKLSSIYTNQTNPISLISGTFYGVDKNNCIIYVPKGTKTLYEKIGEWNEFSQIVEMITTVLNLNTNNEIQIYGYKDRIIINGTIQGETISVFNLKGFEIHTVKSKGESLNLPFDRNAIYLVKTREKTFKVIL